MTAVDAGAEGGTMVDASASTEAHCRYLDHTQTMSVALAPGETQRR